MPGLKVGIGDKTLSDIKVLCGESPGSYCRTRCKIFKSVSYCRKFAQHTPSSWELLSLPFSSWELKLFEIKEACSLRGDCNNSCEVLGFNGYRRCQRYFGGVRPSDWCLDVEPVFFSECVRKRDFPYRIMSFCWDGNTDRLSKGLPFSDYKVEGEVLSLGTDPNNPAFASIGDYVCCEYTHGANMSIYDKAKCFFVVSGSEFHSYFEKVS